MNFTLRQLRYLCAVAEAGSIAAAAQRLAISQPAISAAVAQLEREAGTSFFLRQPAQGLAPTEAGRAFLARARGLLEHAEEVGGAARSLGEGSSGSLTLGCFSTLAPVHLPRLAKAFQATQPGIELDFREGSLDGLQADLLSGVLELALLYDLDLDRRLEAERLAELPPYVLLAAGDPLAARDSLDLAELAERPMVLLDLPHSREYFRSLFLARGLEPRVARRTASYELLRALVGSGFGYALLNVRPATDRAYDGSRLVQRPLADPPPGLALVLARVAAARPTRRALLFADFARGFFATAGATC
ncbi:DNA-binding transcriptional regulator, LysR family [Tistlia consotensis]|uniref:DNA-binding transcriptional regulator, LysR family n=1 Tax=Tistlia consotensis USBA 355 TaxID=560819 RepID=A0A1Y6BQV8_9PROT|nr:LysR substrate-binding domain-containing protein [Tistlia consotensis]SMF23475.1 DNA-binding transcriptional regulator, LysR family [Tistlia consotensis USBA 355]SNR61606.1 DNA-binding transcriptional regulator, LysR family [Tistlia consotensis]